MNAISKLTWCKYVAHSDILNEVWVDARALDEGFKGTGEEISAGGVLEASATSLGDGGAQT